MLLSNIMIYIGMHLGKTPCINGISVQRYIMSKDEVGKAISMEDIETALDQLSYAGFIEESYLNKEKYWRKTK